MGKRTSSEKEDAEKLRSRYIRSSILSNNDLMQNSNPANKPVSNQDIEMDVEESESKNQGEAMDFEKDIESYEMAESIRRKKNKTKRASSASNLSSRGKSRSKSMSMMVEKPVLRRASSSSIPAFDSSTVSTIGKSSSNRKTTRPRSKSGTSLPHEVSSNYISQDKEVNNRMESEYTTTTTTKDGDLYGNEFRRSLFTRDDESENVTRMNSRVSSSSTSKVSYKRLDKNYTMMDIEQSKLPSVQFTTKTLRGASDKAHGPAVTTTNRKSNQTWVTRNAIRQTGMAPSPASSTASSSSSSSSISGGYSSSSSVSQNRALHRKVTIPKPFNFSHARNKY